MAAGLIAAAHKSGLSVPEELSTAGFNLVLLRQLSGLN
jgi:DNA-binding LacI/PurR family transcriptional regulator